MAALISTTAHALTAADVTEKLNSDQRSSFVAGAVDMASHMFAVNGDQEKARCTLDWFFESESPWPEIHSFFEEHSERDAVAVLHVLINRKCGQ